MILFPLKHSEISVKNLVFFLKTEEDMEMLGFLTLDKNIQAALKKSLKNTESSLKEYFIWGRKYETVYVFVDKEESYEKSVNFLGKHFPKLPEELCLFSWNTETLVSMYEVCQLSRHSLERYKSKKKKLITQVFLRDIHDKKELKKSQELVENICLARDLWETPACDLTPEIFAGMVKSTKFKKIKVKVLSYKDIQKKKLWLIEWVGKWSENKPCMVILEHIVDKKKPIHGIVWKGVTFDTGWNQIKPGDFMYEMKGDMGWAAVTFALMKQLDSLKLDTNIVACLALAENVVSSNAYKPSDILTSYCGKTVEIIHTDAEGRLVLADGMSYLGKNYKTSSMMTIATLTGAVMVALWFRYAGIMGTDRDMLDSLLTYSKNNTEKYIELPFADHFLEKTKSDIADLKNLDRSVHAGSSMGAAFCLNFLVNNEKYTHIDIAGAYINGAEAYGKMPKWMTGFGVESLSSIFKNM